MIAWRQIACRLLVPMAAAALLASCASTMDLPYFEPGASYLERVVY